MNLDHATIVTGDLNAARHFLCSVVGLSEGPRPPFSFGGCWLYANGRPVIHLIEASAPAHAGSAAPRIDHVALRVNNAKEWTGLLQRMRSNGIPFELGEVPLTGEHQLFADLATSVTIEIVTKPQPLSQ